MDPQPTREQRQECESALKIGKVLASTVGTKNALRIRVNPYTLNEAVGIYTNLGAKIPLLQGKEEFVRHCLLYSAETFAACAQRVVLCHYLIGRDVVYWFGNGKVKAPEPLDNVKFFAGDNRLIFASILIEQPVFLRLQPFLAPQP